MRKKLWAILLSAVVAGSLAACGSPGSSTSSSGSASTADTTETAEDTKAEAADTGIKVGWSLITTSDPVIAQTLKLGQQEADEKGIDFLVSDAGNDSSKQIDAVENFIESGCDVIIIQAIDATSMAQETARAQEKGIKVIAYGIGIDGADVWYKNDNTVTGTAIGEMASDWINETKGGEANVYIIGYSLMDVLVERADAIQKAIEDNCPNAVIVGRFDAIDAEAGMTNTESMLAAHPEVDVICSISDGSATGAYEAVKTAGKDTDDFGIFGSDLSTAALQLIKNGTCYRGTIDVDNIASGPNCIDMAYRLATGEKVDAVITMGCKPVTIDNVSDYDDLLTAQ